MSTSNKEMLNRLVYVGNLPPDATAEEMKQLCSQVGEVIRFNIVYDRETQQPKGFGYCEYRDPKLVDAAVELLHKFEHRGVCLFVRRAEKHNQSQSIHSQSNKRITPQKKKTSKNKVVDEIARVIASLSTSEKREILSEIKQLIEDNEEGLKTILEENPQLAQALLLIQLEFNLVKPHDVHALTQYVPNTEQPTESKDNNMDIDDDIDMIHPPKQVQQQQRIPAKRTAPQNTQIPVNNIKSKNTEQINEGKLKGLSATQQGTLGRVMNMTPEQIKALPIHVQKQIRTVQAQLAKRNKQNK